MTADRQRWAMILLRASEITIMAMVVSVTLLYTPRLADNFLGKTALFHMVTGVAVFAWGLARLLEGHMVWPRSALHLPFILLLTISAVAASGARNLMLALETWLAWAQWLALFVVSADLARDPTRSRRLVLCLLGLAGVVSAIGLLQVVGYDLMSLPTVFRGVPLSSLGNTNFVAHYIEIVLPLALALSVYGGWSVPRWSTRFRVLAGFVAAICAVMLVLGGSRGGWFGVGVAAVAMVWAAPRAKEWGRRLLLAALAAGLLSPVAGFVLESVPLTGGGTAADAIEEVVDASWARAMTTFDPAHFSRAMRLLIWRDSLELVADSPWLGVGPGHFGLELPAHRSTIAQREWQQLMGRRGNQPYHAHNEYLETWADAGVFGAAALVWLLAAGLWSAWRLAQVDLTDREVDRSLAVGCLGALAAATTHAFFSFNLRDPVSGTHVWILCGLVAGATTHLAGSEGRFSLTGLWRRVGLLTTIAIIAASGMYSGLCMLLGDVYFLQSQHHRSEGYGNRAILSLRNAVSWRGHESAYHHWRGKMALDMKRHGEAVEALTRSLELNENNPGASRLLARALGATGQWARAIEPLRHAIGIDGLTADNYSLLADALKGSGQQAEAVTARRQAVSLRGDPRLLLALGLDHLAAGHLDSAIAVLEQAAHTAPQDAVIVGNLGALLVKAGQPSAGEARLRRALDLEPERSDWHGNLGLALAAQGRFPEALEAAQRARRAQPGNTKWQQLVRQLEILIRKGP